ncbi:MAG: elongation factor G [Magnetococcales bacterium]|nr:elongation factor G [Magnetococcales bacterium]
MTTSPHDIKKIRNVALISHHGGGKTTLVESLLFNSKTIDKRGTVEKGTTHTSSEPEEVQRGMTLSTHLSFCNWRGTDLNIVDTPGYIDFLESTRSVLNVVGGAVMMFSGEMGVKPENIRLWQFAVEAMVPVIGFINKMDKPRADFIRVLGEMESSLEKTVLPVTIPIGAGDDFRGIVDLLPKTAWSAKNGVFEQIELPDEVKDDVEYYRTQLVEKIVEYDDDLLEKYLEDGEEPDEETLQKGLKEAVITRKLLVVFCGSAQANIGVRALLNGISAYMASPLDKATIKPLIGHHPNNDQVDISPKPDVSDPLSAVVFKTTIDPFAGRLSIIRVFSGYIESDQVIYNGTQQSKEKGGRLFKIQGKDKIPVDRLNAGDMGAIAKLSHTHTGDTISTEKYPLKFAMVQFHDPTLAFAIEVDKNSDEKASSGLERLVEEDPTLRFFRDGQTNEMILAGMGQTHLQVTLERLKRKFNTEVTLKAPKVPYKETLVREVRVQGRVKKQTGGRGQFGNCWLVVTPAPRGAGFRFENKIVGGAIPRAFIPSVEKGVVEAMAKGGLGGYPVVDVNVCLVDGSFHSVDSSDNAFRAAGSLAFNKAMDEGGAVLLEPVMSLEATVPNDVVGDVIGDLNARRGHITGATPKVGSQIVKAEVPMAEVLDYGNTISTLTSGRGLYTMQISTYQIVPSHIVRILLEKKG